MRNLELFEDFIIRFLKYMWKLVLYILVIFFSMGFNFERKFICIFFLKNIRWVKDFVNMYEIDKMLWN